MKRADILCKKNEMLLLRFSSECLNRLKEYPGFAVIFSLLHGFLNDNVMKEVEKDTIIIHRAAGSFASGIAGDRVDIHEIFDMTREVDIRFLQKILVPPLQVMMSHDTIEDVRDRRISLIVNVVYDLLRKWKRSMSFSDAVRATYVKDDFRKILFRGLDLYANETRILGRSVKLLPPLNHVKDDFVTTLSQIMDDVGYTLARDIAHDLFTGKETTCHSRT